MAKFAVLLSGCGYLDGSEIQEAVSTLLAIDKLGSSYQCFALNSKQHHVIDHSNNQESGEERNMLVEAARIARGKIKSVSEIMVEDFDAIILPGGYGVAKNFFPYAFSGIDATVDPLIEDILRRFHKAKKYIGAICMAPALIAKVFAKDNPILTMGSEENCKKILEPFGARFEAKKSSEITIDKENKIISTPAYMNDESISQIYAGIEKLIKYIA
jgi:enhancing lycopene biosynthesis protein 2